MQSAHWHHHIHRARLVAKCSRRGIAYTLPRRAAEPTSRAAQSPDTEGKADLHAAPAKSAKAAKDLKADDRLPFLQRPLGTHERPTTIPLTWREEMMDQDIRLRHRKSLVKEAAKGYFSDLNATRKHGGKTWIAPKVLIREDKALYFPDIKGTTLNSKDPVHTTDLFMGKVSVVAMLSSKISELQTKMFVEPTNAAFLTNPSYQFLQINLQENLLKSMLVSLFAGSIRKSVPEEHWPRYLISSQNMDYVRDDLGMTNRHVGYVYLVDAQCRVRWAGCADPKSEETEALRVCTEVLLNRVNRPGNGPPPP